MHAINITIYLIDIAANKKMAKKSTQDSDSGSKLRLLSVLLTGKILMKFF